MSARPSTADVDQGNGMVSFVPNCDIERAAAQKKKPPEGGLSIRV
jgi:hypothetical protein